MRRVGVLTVWEMDDGSLKLLCEGDFEDALGGVWKYVPMGGAVQVTIPAPKSPRGKLRARVRTREGRAG